MELACSPHLFPIKKANKYLNLDLINIKLI